MAQGADIAFVYVVRACVSMLILDVRSWEGSWHGLAAAQRGVWEWRGGAGAGAEAERSGRDSGTRSSQATLLELGVGDQNVCGSGDGLLVGWPCFDHGLDWIGFVSNVPQTLLGRESFWTPPAIVVQMTDGDDMSIYLLPEPPWLKFRLYPPVFSSLAI